MILKCPKCGSIEIIGKFICKSCGCNLYYDYGISDFCIAVDFQTQNNDDMAFKYFLRAAEKGLPDAQDSLASYYAHGIGTNVDIEKSNYWLTKAAESGFADAQGQLGLNYINGKGFDKDIDLAIYWWKKAADNYSEKAHLLLGRAYYDKGDYLEAFSWFNRAAKYGYAEAMFYIGEMYQYGRGVSVDELEAFVWYSKAAEHGESYAFDRLGYLSFHGGGELRQDTEDAVLFYRKASELGVPNSQETLSQIYAQLPWTKNIQGECRVKIKETAKKA